MNAVLILKYIFGNLLFLLSAIVPKDPKRWVFGAWAGRSYSDNSKYLFEYVCREHPDIDCAWLTRNRDVHRRLEANGTKVYMTNSVSGFLFALRAGVGVISNVMMDINRYVCARMLIVHLWHGIPLKPCLYADPKSATIRKVKLKTYLSYLFPFLKRDLDFTNALIPSSSVEVQRLFEWVFNSRNIRLTGFPRNDSFYKRPNADDGKNVGHSIQELRDSGFTVGIYMPTWRQSHEVDITKLLTEHYDEIDAALRRNKMVLYLKLHSLHQFTHRTDGTNGSVRLLSSHEIGDDVYSVLSLFDFLITDYSSITFDYVTLERPIILAAFDYEDYVRTNGRFTYDTLEQFGLPIARSWNDVTKLLEEVKRKPYPRADELRRLNDRFNAFRDSDNSKRVFEEIVRELRLTSSIQGSHV